MLSTVVAVTWYSDTHLAWRPTQLHMPHVKRVPVMICSVLFCLVRIILQRLSATGPLPQQYPWKTWALLQPLFPRLTVVCPLLVYQPVSFQVESRIRTGR